jgi:hypothetical protein
MFASLIAGRVLAECVCIKCSNSELGIVSGAEL